MVLIIQKSAGHERAFAKRHKLQTKSLQSSIKKTDDEFKKLRQYYAAKVVRGDVEGASALIQEYFKQDANILSSKGFLIAFHTQLVELAQAFETLAPNLTTTPLDDYRCSLITALQDMLVKYQDCAQPYWRVHPIWSLPTSSADELSNQWLMHTKEILEITALIVDYWRGKFFIDGDKNAEIKANLTDMQKRTYYDKLLHHHDIQLNTYIDYMKHRKLKLEEHAQLQLHIRDGLQLVYRRFGEKGILNFSKLYMQEIEKATDQNRSIDLARRIVMINVFTEYAQVIQELLPTWQPFDMPEPVEAVSPMNLGTDVWAELDLKLTQSEESLRDLAWPVYLQAMKRQVDTLQALLATVSQLTVLQTAIAKAEARCEQLILLAARANDASHVPFLEAYRATLQAFASEVARRQASDQHFKDMLASLNTASPAVAPPSVVATKAATGTDSRSPSPVTEALELTSAPSLNPSVVHVAPPDFNKNPAGYWYHCSSIAFKNKDLATTRAYLLKALPIALASEDALLRVNIAIDLTELEQIYGHNHIKRKDFARAVEAYEHSLQYCQIAHKDDTFLSENNHIALSTQLTLLSRQLEMHEQHVQRLIKEHESYKEQAIKEGTWARPSRHNRISQPSLIYKSLKTHNVAPRLAQLQT